MSNKNNMPPQKKRSVSENTNTNKSSIRYLTDESKIKQLPLRSVRAGSKEYLGYYDKENLVIYLTNEEGNLTGQTGTLKKPLAEYTDGMPINSNKEDDDETPENNFDNNKADDSNMPVVSTKKKVTKKTNSINEDGKKKKSKKLLVVIIISIIAIAICGIFGYTIYFRTAPTETVVLEHVEGQVMVMQIKNDVLPGDVIEENNLQPVNIDNQTYNQITANGNELYKWEQKKTIAGMYASEYISAGKYITSNAVTKLYKVDDNPWENRNSALKYVDIPLKENEFKFDELRIGDKINLDFEVSRKEDNNTETMESVQPGVSVVSENKVTTTMSYNIQGLTIVNLITSDNKKLFDTYSSLMKIPEANQELYFKTTIEKDNNLISTLTPAKVRICLDEIYADAMATAITSKSDINIKKSDETDTVDNSKKKFYDNETIIFDNISEALKTANRKD
ncbi:MAG: hypothetical protein IJT36_04145 [Alphaproteobacteria bacterium]|nr:hypothetical protein [Alphaproteobacteria bacterium]